MNIFKRISAVLVVILAMCGLALAQTTTTSTSLSAAVSTTSATQIAVTSATGFTVGNLVYVNRELMQITSITGTNIGVRRGTNGTAAGTHASGSRVYTGPAGAGGPFIGTLPIGTCTATSQNYLPQINAVAGKVFNCISSKWIENDSNGLGLVRYPYAVATTDSTAGALTYTPAMLLGGIILRDPNGAGRSDVTPTAALLVAAMPGAVIGSSFEFTIRNTADAAETITVTAGTDCTLSGTMTIAQNNSKRFLVVFTAVTGTPAYTLYSLGTVVH